MRVRKQAAIFIAALALVGAGACAPRAASPGSACTLTQPANSSIGHDVPTAVAPFGDGVVSIGSQFTGSSGSGFSAFGSVDAKRAPRLGEHTAEVIEELRATEESA